MSAAQGKPEWTIGCDLSHHDDGIALLVRLPSGREASACLECLVEARRSGMSKADILAMLEDRVERRTGKKEDGNGQGPAA